jgi:predicted RNase H-like HicB family nuclease
MLSEYLSAAMRRARYELIENGRYYGAIPVCKGCWAEAANLEACREELKSVLEDWLLLGLQLGHQIPVIEGIDLNRSKTKSRGHAQADKA